jgi:hypothetical protein
MTSPYNDAYSDEFEQRGPVYEGVTHVLLTVSLTLWACIWGVIWLLSGLYIALHFREDNRRPAPSAPSPYEDDL